MAGRVVREQVSGLPLKGVDWLVETLGWERRGEERRRGVGQ
jgi:hypothetical protein